MVNGADEVAGDYLGQTTRLVVKGADEVAGD